MWEQNEQQTTDNEQRLLTKNQDLKIELTTTT